MTDRHHLRLIAPLSGVLLPLLVLASPACAQNVIQEGCAVIHTLEGEATNDSFGWVSNALEDVNDDGVREMIITAPGNDAGGITAGRVYVYSGADAKLLYHVTGEGDGWALGNDAADAGDVTGDGKHDLICGAPGNGTGRVRIYDGVDGTFVHEIVGEASGDQFGHRVWGGGDFDGDKVPDLLVGAPFHDTAGGNAGRAYVYSGVDYTLLCTIDGDVANDQLGFGVAFVGDVSQPADGRDDIVVGARNAGGGGGLAYVHAYDGETCQRLHVLDPGPPRVNMGQWFMNGGGDVDGDEVPDVYVSDWSGNRAHVFSGLDGSVIWSLDGEGEGGGFGIGRMVPDVNDDGRADLILAAWASNQGAGGAGKAFLYSGIDGSVIHTYTHTRQGANFGFDANGMGDVDGDGVYDYLVTAASDLGATGRAYLISGNEPGPREGDANLDCVVNFTDITKLLNQWGKCPPPPAACLADFNEDGVVDFADLLIILANWDT